MFTFIWAASNPLSPFIVSDGDQKLCWLAGTSSFTMAPRQKYSREQNHVGTRGSNLTRGLPECDPMRSGQCRASCDSNADSERQHQVTRCRVLQSSSYSATASSWRISSCFTYIVSYQSTSATVRSTGLLRHIPSQNCPHRETIEVRITGGSFILSELPAAALPYPPC